MEAQWRRREIDAPGSVQELESRGLNQVLLIRIALGSLLVLGGGSLAAALMFHSDIEAVGPGPGPVKAQRELLEALERLHGAWAPAERQRILDGASQHEGRWVGALRGILGQWDHPLRLEAIEYAGATGAAELRSDVARLAFRGRADSRAAAVRATERLGLWEHDDLVGFLASGIPMVQVAALEIVGARQEAPWGNAFSLLASGNAKVRQAAVASVPLELPPEAAAALWAVIEAGPDEVSALGLTALRGTKRVRDFEARVQAFLAVSDAGVRFAALECLMRMPGPLAEASPVRALAWDVSAELELRGKAFRCLEVRGGYDVELVKARLFMLEPKLRYLAARCLVATGETDGLLALAELVEGEELAVAVASRRLLAQLTGLSPQASQDEFHDRVSRGVRCSSPLPEPALSF